MKDMMQVPVAKPFFTKSDAKAAYDVVLSGWVTQGPRVEEFEEIFAGYVGAKYAVAVSSCTTALHLALLTAGIGAGDEVICPSLSFISTANSIMYARAKPVFAEAGPLTYNIDPACAEELITRRTKAILIVHQMGMPADIDAFKALCRKYGLVLIEDAACALGAKYKGRRIGAHSGLVCFSFHPRKIITTGEGGMITTSNKGHYERLRRLRQYGMSKDDRLRHLSKRIVFEDYLELGYNYRMTDIQAAVGIEQMKKLARIVSRRREIAGRYNRAFKDIACLRLPLEAEGYFTNYQSYAVYLKKCSPVSRDGLMQRLLDSGISTRRGIMTAHRTAAYKKYFPDLRLPVSEDLSDNSIILPLYVPMADSRVDYVIDKVSGLLNRRGNA